MPAHERYPEFTGGRRTCSDSGIAGNLESHTGDINMNQRSTLTFTVAVIVMTCAMTLLPVTAMADKDATSIMASIMINLNHYPTSEDREKLNRLISSETACSQVQFPASITMSAKTMSPL